MQMNRREFIGAASTLISAAFGAEFLWGGEEQTAIAISGNADPALAGFDVMMRKFMEENDIPGASMAIGRRGKIVYARGFGLANTDTNAPVQPDSLFRICSLSKAFTAAAIFQLQERGKLKLADPAFKLIDIKPHLDEGASIDPRLRTITIAQLLHHTGGFDRNAREGYDPMFRSVAIAKDLGIKPPAGARDVIAYMMGRPLDFDPGTREVYSNFGYCVLGRVIEHLSGLEYSAYVQREILKPLGIHRMRMGRSLEKDAAPGEVHYYPHAINRRVTSVFGDGKSVPIPYGGWYQESLDAHGGWIASAPELVRFATCFDDPTHCPILSKQSIAEMFQRPRDTGFDAEGKPKAAYYACGWNVRPMGHNTENTWHTGLLDGSATLVVRRCDGLTWALFFNRDYDAVERWPVGNMFKDSE
jgi:N-acyl-D-amino-acid deacylase